MSSREACSPLHLFINHQSYIINQQTIKKLGASSNGNQLLRGRSSNSSYFMGHCISLTRAMFICYIMHDINHMNIIKLIIIRLQPMGWARFCPNLKAKTSSIKASTHISSVHLIMHHFYYDPVLELPWLNHLKSLGQKRHQHSAW